MAYLFVGLLFVSIGVLGYSGVRGLKDLFTRNRSRKRANKRLALFSAAAMVVSFVGVGISAEPSGTEAVTTIDSSEVLLIESVDKEQEETKAQDEKLALEKKDKEKEKEQEALEKAQIAAYQVNQELSKLAYKDQQTIEVNDGVPTFIPEELSIQAGAWETYGDLDELNRATSAQALLHQSFIPTQKRGDISSVTPTGWKNKKIGKSYLYNRSHLIGFALSGENANWKNLITGTTQLNNPEMLRHEMDIKTYLEKSPKNFVRYSVVPIFREEELLARGVHLMAQSIESDTIQINVYIFNIQSDVTLNYADGSSETKDEKTAIEEAETKRLSEEKEQAETEQLAKEKMETERIAAEQAETQRLEKEQAERDRLATEQQAEQQRMADEQAAQSSVEIVYVATQSGEKYHYDQNCRGLSQANTIAELTKHDAIGQGYTLCGWED